jgi:hypothetical protein
MVLVDESQWPLVIVNWPAGALTEAHVDDALRLLTGCYGRPHAVLHDGLRATDLGGPQRRRLMQHATHYQDEIRRSVVASAAVVESAWWRGIIKLVQSVAPPVEPFRTFATRTDGEEWLRQALRRAGLWRPAVANGG